jgi:hypothetical protein
MTRGRYNPVDGKFYTQDEVEDLIAEIGLDEVLLVDPVSPDQDLTLTNGTLRTKRLLAGGV